MVILFGEKIIYQRNRFLFVGPWDNNFDLLFYASLVDKNYEWCTGGRNNWRDMDFEVILC